MDLIYLSLIYILYAQFKQQIKIFYYIDNCLRAGRISNSSALIASF